MPAGRLDMSFSYNSRIDRARSRLTSPGPDHSQSVLKIAPDGPPNLIETDHEPGDTRRLCRALAGAGGRRPHHARRRALHGHGPLTRGVADRSVRLSVDRHPRPYHHRAVDRSRRRVVPCCSGAPAAGASGPPGQSIERTCISIAGWSALALVFCEGTPSRCKRWC